MEQIIPYFNLKFCLIAILAKIMYTTGLIFLRGGLQLVDPMGEYFTSGALPAPGRKKEGQSVLPLLRRIVLK